MNLLRFEIQIYLKGLQ